MTRWGESGVDFQDAAGSVRFDVQGLDCRFGVSYAPGGS